MDERNKHFTTVLTKDELSKKPKLQIFNLLMMMGSTRVSVDPAQPDVSLPDYLLNEQRVWLEFGYNLPKPIPDLTVSSFALEATLLFNDIPFSVVIPWDAVTAITDERGVGVFYGPELSHGDVVSVESDSQRKSATRNLTPEQQRKTFKVIKGGKN